MANSSLFLGIKNMVAAKLGTSDVKLALGTKLLYPLSKPINDAVVTCDSATYNGSNQVAQNIVVTLSGVTLVSGTDYTVTSNTGGTNAGSYNVTVSGAGNYEGSASGTFVINKANSSLSFTVTNLTVEEGGTAINAVTVNAGDGTVTYSSNNTSIITVDNNGSITGTGVGNAVITADISQTNNYNSASATYTADCKSAIVAKYNITSTSSPTRIIYSGNSFSSIEIDGVIQPSVTTGYTFSTTGEHTVKCYLTGTSIGDYAFSGCTNLASIDIPNGATSIGSSAFRGCSGMTACTIGSGVTSIGGYSFYNCRSLTSIDIPNSVTRIGYAAFQSCTSLTNIEIPDSVTIIGVMAFYSCTGLTSCTIGSGVTTIDRNAFQSCTSLTSIDIPDSVTSIGAEAFKYCGGITSCTIGSGVTSIGQSAFTNCYNLTSIDIPDTVTSIGESVFDTTPWWSTYSADTSHHYGNIVYINDVAYKATSTSITSCTFREGTVSIVGTAFRNCTSLTSVTIPNSVTSIGSYAFSNCTSLSTCTMGSGITSIENYAFSGCTSLTSIVSDAITAPTIYSSTFKNVGTNGTLTVPIGSSGYNIWMSTSNYYLGSYNWTKVEQ